MTQTFLYLSSALSTVQKQCRPVDKKTERKRERGSGRGGGGRRKQDERERKIVFHMSYDTLFESLVCMTLVCVCVVVVLLC